MESLICSRVSLGFVRMMLAPGYFIRIADALIEGSQGYGIWND
jgi:hypothetical protein